MYPIYKNVDKIKDCEPSINLVNNIPYSLISNNVPSSKVAGFRDYSYLKENLNYLNNLHTPIWIYDVGNWRQAWANKTALILWKCEKLEDFLAKEFTNNSPATDDFLFGLLKYFSSEGRGETVIKQWTIYPNNNP